MSKSIVLDLNKSADLAQNYWRTLGTETASLWATQRIVKSKSPLQDLGNSLAYYYKDVFIKSGSQEWARKLSALQASSSESIYHNELLIDLKSAGLQLPKDVTLANTKIGREVLMKSLELICKVWPAGFSELSHYLSGIVIIESDSIRSLTGPTWFGAIFLGSKMLTGGSLVEITTSLLHEVGHLALFAQSALSSPLEDIRQEIYSPFMGRERPALMVFHAQIAMARMLIWLQSLIIFSNKPENAQFCAHFSTSDVTQASTEYSQYYLEGMAQLRKMTITAGGQPMMQDFEAIERLLLGKNL